MTRRLRADYWDNSAGLGAHIVVEMTASKPHKRVSADMELVESSVSRKIKPRTGNIDY
jgi:hypothetical protein